MSRKVRLYRLASFRSSFDASSIVSHHNISKLKHKFKGPADDWETILSHFLLQKQPGADDAKLLDNVRMVYALKDDSIDIIVQQDVKGIKASRAGLGNSCLPLGLS